MCKVLKVSRSGFYAWLNHSPSKLEIANKELIHEIKEIHHRSRGTYGSPRIKEELDRRNFKVSRPRVARLMKKEGIRSKVKRRFVRTTDSKHSFQIAPNLLQRKFKVNSPGMVWVSDITYIKTKQGWLYLTVVIDLFDRRVIGWSLSSSMHADTTTIAAFRMAVKNRKTKSSLIFHSDRGVQYACEQFKQLLNIKNIKQSMSRKGDCWDNAVAESFFKTIKTECTYHYQFESKSQAARYIFEYIEVWYNRKRRHSALNYATPLEMEIFFNNQLAA